jgi:hypothetical protein
LAIDLLSAALETRVERFKPGKDNGVDGRWFCSANKEAVVQCKHWIGSGYKMLLAHLVTAELPKIHKLRPARYILVTSVPLSRANKREIRKALDPFILREDDVFGPEDLNSLLGTFTQIEQGHYKLWLSSSAVLSTLINRAILGRSGAELEQIRAEAPLYVPTADHIRASEQLQDRRALILTGEPGIGKTTLARQLGLEHAAGGWDFIVIEEDISEAENVFSDDARQFFYFDDFLGRTFLEAIRTKQDSHIVRFLSRVARDPQKRFVLTSRTNILNQGATLSDVFAEGRVLKDQYELTIGALRRIDRARILYNHIWHSKVDPGFVDELYLKKRYQTVVAHKNFNPRLASFVVDDDKLSGLTPSEYWPFVLRTFDNPRGVWQLFVDAQLDQDGRDLAYLAVLNGGKIFERNLRDAFEFLRRESKLSPGELDHDYRVAERHTAGSVLNRNIEGRFVHFTLFNPSVADFVQERFRETHMWSAYYLALRTMESLNQLQQMRAETFFGQQPFTEVIEALINREREHGFIPDDYNAALAHLALAVPEAEQSGRALISPWMSYGEIPISMDKESYLRLYVRAAGIVDDAVLLDKAELIASVAQSGWLPIDDPEFIAGLIHLLGRLGADDAESDVRHATITNWSDIAEDEAKKADVLSGYVSDDDGDDAHRELRHWTTARLAEYGVELSLSEAADISELVDVYQIIENNREVSSREDEAYNLWRDDGATARDDVADIDDLFDRS